MKSFLCFLIIVISFCFSSKLIGQSKFNEKVVFELKDKSETWDKYFSKEESFESDKETCKLYFNKTGEYVYFAPELGRLYKKNQLCIYYDDQGFTKEKLYTTKFNYRSDFGIKMHSVEGYIINSSTCKNSEDIAITTINKNPKIGDFLASFYINDSLVAIESCKKDSMDKIHRFDDVSKRLEHQRWCAFSENGNKIYFVYKEGKYVVYLNGKQIHKSNFPYADLGISNNGNYFFIEQDTVLKLDFIKDKNGRDVFTGSVPKYKIHLPGRTIDSVQAIINYKMLDDGGFCIEGEYTDKSKFIYVNNNLLNKVGYSPDITIVDKNNFLYTAINEVKGNSNKIDNVEEEFDQFTQKSSYVVNCNGKEFILNDNQEESILTNLDSKGNFSYFEKGGSSYENNKFNRIVTNGVNKYDLIKDKEIYNPLYFSADGKSCFYETRDYDNKFSTFYENDKKLFSFRCRKVQFFSPIFAHNYGGSETNNILTQPYINLYYLRTDTLCYIVYMGKLSHPIPNNFKELSMEELERIEEDRGFVHNFGIENLYQISNIIKLGYNEKGFYVIYKKDKSFFVNINNNVYKEIGKIDKIIPDNYFFDGKELIFYAIRQNKVYQIKVSAE